MNIALNINTRVYRIAISAFFFVAGLTFATWASRIPDIKSKLQLSDAALGLILFALPVGQMVSLPLSAALVSRFGSKSLIITGALLYPLSLILLSVSGTGIALAFSLFVFGIWANLLNIAMNTQAVSVENIYGRSIMASFHGVWSMAGFAGALAGTFFVSNSISPLLHFTIICIVTGLVVWAAYRHTVPSDMSETGEKKKLFVKPDSRILLLGMIAFCCMVCEGAMADWSGVYYQKVVQAPAALTTVGYVAFMGTMATGRFFGDWLVTKFGVTRILQLSGVLIAGGLVTAVLLPNMATATIGFLMVGFGVSSVVPVVFSLAGKSKNMSPGAALASVSTISFLGFLIGPPVIGFVAELTSLRISFLIIALLGFGTTLLASKTKQID
ncbi:MAG: MFS transporter [Chitinophagaceae bacterium]|nr:MFS transporter [Chitinophagaceae bacterium]